jgi:long-chain acyl-CoA synthetase
MDAMSATADPAGIAAFTAAGQPFELTDAVVRGIRCRVFRNAPRTLNQLYGQARSHRAQVFTVADGERLTYGEVFARAAALAADLAAHGVGRGTHVAIAMRNCPEWLVAFIAVTALGAVPVLVNSRGAAEEIAAGLADTGCRHAVADARRAALIERGDCAGISGVVAGGIPATRAGGAGWRGYEQILARECGASLPAADCAP